MKVSDEAYFNFFSQAVISAGGGYFRRAVQGRSARGRLRVLSCSCGLECFRIAAAAFVLFGFEVLPLGLNLAVHFQLGVALGILKA